MLPVLTGKSAGFLQGTPESRRDVAFYGNEILQGRDASVAMRVYR